MNRQSSWRLGFGNSGRIQLAASLAILILTAAAVWLLGGPRLGGLLKTTLLLGAGASLLATPLGTAAAILFVRTDLPGRKVLAAAWLAMLFVPLYLVLAGWEAAVGRLGWQTTLWSSQSEPLLSGLRGAIWIHALGATPWTILIVSLGLLDSDSRLEEESLLDASPWGVIFRTTLPNLAPWIVAATLFTFITAASEMTVTNIFLVSTFAEDFFLAMQQEEDPSLLARRVLPGLGLSSWLIVAGLVAAEIWAPRRRETPLRSSLRFRLGGLRFPLCGCVLLAWFVAAGVPLVSLFLQTGWHATFDPASEAWVRSWSFARAWELLSAAPFRHANEIGWTIAIGLLGANGAVVAAIPLALAARRGGWFTAPAVFAIAVGFASPGPLVGLVLGWIFNRPVPAIFPYLQDHTILMPCLAMALRGTPAATLILWRALASIPPAELDAASADGAGIWRRWGRIILPQRLAAMAGAFLLPLAISLGDLSAAQATVPPGISTVAIRVFGLVHAGADGQVAALAIHALIVHATIAAIAGGCWLRSERQMNRSGN